MEITIELQIALFSIAPYQYAVHRVVKFTSIIKDNNLHLSFWMV